MSLSTPTTVNPLPVNCRAASAPINPAEPVMTAMLMVSYLLRQDGLELRALIDQPAPNILENLIQRALLFPAGHACHGLTIADIERNIGVARFSDATNLNFAAGELLTYRCQFAQRKTIRHAAAHVEQAAREFIQSAQLADDKIIQVIDVQHVAHLQDVAAETHVRKRRTKKMTRKPQHHEALIDLAHLPRP